MPPAPNPDRIAARNRKARYNYFIEDTLEVGIMLTGSEVKSLREGRGNIAEAYAVEKDGELWLHNAYIPEYAQAGQFNHDTRRSRKLLAHRREIDKLADRVQKGGMTLVPLDVHFTNRGIAKILLGVARGKRKFDKRETQKKRDWQRQKERLVREKG